MELSCIFVDKNGNLYAPYKGYFCGFFYCGDENEIELQLARVMWQKM